MGTSSKQWQAFRPDERLPGRAVRRRHFIVLMRTGPDLYKIQHRPRQLSVIIFRGKKRTGYLRDITLCYAHTLIFDKRHQPH